MNFLRIRNMRRLLTADTCETLVLSLCISHLDYGNEILYGLPDITLDKFQHIQNVCAKLMLNMRKYDSNT